jgi:hypothetical protein
MKKLEQFNPEQIGIVNDGVAMVEELVSNFYKMSANQWSAMGGYDIKTLADLLPEEIVDKPFAQILRYEGRRKDTFLGSSIYDFYKICLQDHTILSVLRQSIGLKLSPFILYIVTHELVHIVRFCKFLQSFDALPEKKMAEETRVHKKTREILKPVPVSGIADVFRFYDNWCKSFDEW